MQRTNTICPYCGVGCALTLTVADGRLVAADPGPAPSVNGPALCSKGRFGFDFVTHADRLQAPRIRSRGRLVPASWDDALGLVADTLGSLAAGHGPQCLGGLSSARCTIEENYLFQKLFRAGLGSNNLDHCARL
jgi:formate dehydrogenase major subunit